MPHANAPLAERGRLRLARCVVEQGWSLRRAAERFQVSVPTAKRWADRYRVEGERGMVDRSSRPQWQVFDRRYLSENSMTLLDAKSRDTKEVVQPELMTA